MSSAELAAQQPVRLGQPRPAADELADNADAIDDGRDDGQWQPRRASDGPALVAPVVNSGAAVVQPALQPVGRQVAAHRPGISANQATTSESKQPLVRFVSSSVPKAGKSVRWKIRDDQGEDQPNDVAEEASEASTDVALNRAASQVGQRATVRSTAGKSFNNQGVRHAAQSSSDDPFRDPFGDQTTNGRGVGSRATARQVVQTAAEENNQGDVNGGVADDSDAAGLAAPPLRPAQTNVARLNRFQPAASADPDIQPPQGPAGEAPADDQDGAQPGDANEPEAPQAPAKPAPQFSPPSQVVPLGKPTGPRSLPATPPRSVDTPAPSAELGGREPAAPQNQVQPPGQPAAPQGRLEPATPNRGGLRSPESFLEGPVRGAIYCRRTYNERNCCTDENACNEHRQRVKSHPLSKISLDITPTCNLSARNPNDQGGNCGFPFEQAPSRVWRNRAGEALIEGRVTALANLKVEVTDDEGRSVRLSFRELGEDDLCFIAAWCGVPGECRLDDVPLIARNWAPITMTWKASGVCHKPLYFEETQLERYGHTTGPISQPFVSGAHFFLNIAALPYNMGIHPMNECQYSLGYYRPGSCAPWLVPPIPLSVRGATAETAAVLGGVFLIP